MNRSIDCEYNIQDNLDGFNYLYYIGYGIFGNFFICCGLITNLIIIVLLKRPKLWAVHNIYLISLAGWDSLLLISSFWQFSIWVLLSDNGEIQLHGNRAHFLQLAYVCINVSNTGCVWVCIAVTVDRYAAISNPFGHKTSNNERKAKWRLVLVTLFALLFNLCRYAEVTVKTCVIGYRNESFLSPVIMPSALVNSMIYFVLYRVCGNLLLTHFIPLCTLFILTVRMCLIIRNAQKERLRMTVFGQTFQLIRQNFAQCGGIRGTTIALPQNQSNVDAIDTSANKALVILLIKFITCHSLPMILDLFQMVLSTRVYDYDVFEYITVISNTLVIFNSSNNFLVYYWTGNRFRLELINVLRGCLETMRNQLVLIRFTFEKKRGKKLQKELRCSYQSRYSPPQRKTTAKKSRWPDCSNNYSNKSSLELITLSTMDKSESAYGLVCSSSCSQFDVKIHEYAELM